MRTSAETYSRMLVLKKILSLHELATKPRVCTYTFAKKVSNDAPPLYTGEDGSVMNRPTVSLKPGGASRSVVRLGERSSGSYHVGCATKCMLPSAADMLVPLGTSVVRMLTSARVPSPANHAASAWVMEQCPR